MLLALLVLFIGTVIVVEMSIRPSVLEVQP